MRPIIAAILIQLAETDNLNVVEICEQIGFHVCRIRRACQAMVEDKLLDSVWAKQDTSFGSYKRYSLTHEGRKQLEVAKTVKQRHREKKPPKPKRSDLMQSTTGLRILHMEGHCKATESLLRSTWKRNNKRKNNETVDCYEVACL